MPRTTTQAAFQSIESELRGQLLAGLEGDAGAYRTFLKTLADLLRGYFRRRLTNLPSEVEDLLQEAMMAVHLQRHTYKHDQPLTAWVYAIARYKLMDMWRHHAGHGALHEELNDELAVFAACDVEATDAKRDVAQLLETLPDKQRLPIVHTKLQGLSIKESCALTGLSESATKIGVHRGLKALKKLL